MENRRQNLTETNRESNYKQQEWLEALLGDKSAFSRGNESDDSDKDDENYNENIKVVVHRCS